jgi:hypothetical protein
MTEKLSRRELLKTGVAVGASSAVLRKLEVGLPPEAVTEPLPATADGEILALSCNDGVYVPPRGKSFFKFGFDFPEPSVAYQGLLFSFRLHTFEDCYGMDRAARSMP